MTDKKETIRSRIWQETAQAEDAFAAEQCLCAGYDVYGDLLGKAQWSDYLYLLFKREKPQPASARLLNDLAVSLANAGPRNRAVQAAMNGGVGGSTSAACLMAALAVGAGQLGGGREVYNHMQLALRCGFDLAQWAPALATQEPAVVTDIWEPMEHPPGFDPHAQTCATPLLQTLQHLAGISPGRHLDWLMQNRLQLEEFAQSPLAMTGIAAAALLDLELSPDQAEMMFLLLGLPGAAVHALEQREYGFTKFPFYADGLTILNDPGPRTTPEQGGVNDAQA